ncbi:putative ribonuclease T(2) [Helianthus annuus]|uniref:Putative ribonuclease T2-like protein n=1 Tax=Helianthus annuus TaxID=4232 RepID=A0A251U7A1_HELAN|nr:ribonuclease 2 [Helianthus annuus]KAF5796139.1 putative ribonuclease T(2) [Helianthus annuus]KAJ0554248.1 putative ribonuclease T(2) [Helianthus annuus]KAJ0765465.1 putative ribonuclease T(2) [Helianthus annuus]KAJ0898736.1 putative ribonuclease T(2) [Helianthus annuus]KAJ0902368.1 putative ribonuclease T(2) [Helianthus annuus]
MSSCCLYKYQCLPHLLHHKSSTNRKLGCITTMASHLTTVVLLSVLLFGFTYAVDFDYFTLVLQWPATACEINSKTCCPYNGCCPGGSPPPGFTIRSLWPDYNDGTYPECCEGAPYNENSLSSLSDAMTKYWTILNCKMSSSCTQKRPFWAHQWEKHGTCATSVVGDQQGYFLTTLQLYLKYNVTDVLIQAKIKPSNSKTYPSASIISAIEDAFDTTPQLTCNDDTVYQVRLCFDKEFKVRECVGESNKCPQYVRLPKFAFRNVTTSTEDWLMSTIKSVV